MRALFTGLVKSLITTVIFFAVIELGLRAAYTARNAFVHVVPLPYALGDEYGPIPPWLDRLMILVPDDTLIWRLLPGADRTYLDIFSPVGTAADRTGLLRRFGPTVPSAFARNPTWHVAINSQGFRGDAIRRKANNTIRVACVGDSWTFGMPVDQSQTYPSRLAAWLQQMDPGRHYEVLNLGVLGYTSFQGLQLLSSRVLDLEPDIVAIGFGMNDSEVAGYRDKDMVTKAPPRFRTRVKETVTDLESYKLLDYVALRLKFRPKPIGDYLTEDADDRGSGSVDYSTIEPWTRVSPVDYEGNVRQMVRAAQARGARAVLIDNELWAESPYHPVLQKLSAELGVPLVDSLGIVSEAKQTAARDLEHQLHLLDGVLSAIAPQGSRASIGSPTSTTVVFRAYRGSATVPRSLSITGPDPFLGHNVPNLVSMRDDGKEGDERAGDGVWSFKAAFAPGTRLTYVYTNSGAVGRWEGLDLPTIRHATVPFSESVVYLPLDTFGRLYMQGDNWHTDAAGYDLIARAVAQAIVRQGPAAAGSAHASRVVAPAPD